MYFDPEFLVSLASRIFPNGETFENAWTYLTIKSMSSELSIKPLIPEMLLIAKGGNSHTQ